MPKLKIVGGGFVHVSDKLASKITQMKVDGKDMMVDLGGQGFVELNQIKQILPDDNNTLLDEQKKTENSRKIAEYCDHYDNVYLPSLKRQTVEEKTMRIIASFVKLLWIARGNYGVDISEELLRRLFERISKFFEDNPLEHHAPRNIYEDLVPYGGPPKYTTNVPGMKSIGEMMQSKMF